MDNKFPCTDSKWVIDRFEEHNAVLENTDTLEMAVFPVTALPANARPGDALVRMDGVWRVDHAETERRSAEISELFQRIKNKSQK